MAIFVFKVMTLVVRTAAKPIIQWVTYYNKLKLQEQNTNLNFVKDSIIWTGQAYNYYNIKMNRILFGLSKTEVIKPLSSDKAIEKGAEFLSEFLIYTILITLPILEYIRTNNISKEVEYLRQQEIRRMNNDIDALERQNEILKNRLKEMSMILDGIKTMNEINTKI